MSSPAIALAGFVAGAVVGGLAWSLFSEKNEPLDTPEAAASKAEAGGADELRTENTRLKSDLARLQAELNRRRLAESDAVPKPGAKEAAASKQDAAALAFTDPRFQTALDSIDWDAVGVSMKEMVPLIAKITESLEKGEAVDLALAGELSKHRAELLKAAQKIMEGKIPGSGVNGSFTHPAVVANQFASALKAAGLDLSKDQKESLDRVMKFYSAKDLSLRLAQDSKELQLDVLTEELEFKDAFYKEAKGLLSKEQRAALFSDNSAGRMGLDIFDTTLISAQFARPVQVKDPGELAAAVSGRIGSSLKLDGASRKKLDAIVARWSNGHPADFWQNKSNSLDRQGMMSGTRIRAAARRQATLMREILANIELSPQARKELKTSLRILVPLPK